MPITFRATAALLVLVLLSCLARAAEPDMKGVGVWCDAKFGLCRYVDVRTKQEVFPARFERGMPFSEGLAAVRIDGRFGYIDHLGKVVIAPGFDLGGDFYQGLAEVLVGNKTGIINRQGEMVVPPMFGRAIPWTKDVILAMEGTWTPVYAQGFEKLPGLRDGPYFLHPVGIYHIAGRWIRPPNLKRLMVFELEGRGLVWASELQHGPLGLLASDGRWVVEPQYEYAGPLSDERAIVRQRINGTWLSAAVDPQGRIVVPFQSRVLFGWMNGWGVARESQAENGKQVFLDRNGDVIGGRTFDKVERPEEGDIAFVLIDGRWHGFDRSGKIVPHPRNGQTLAICASGIQLIEMDGRMQISDTNGRPTIPHLFDRQWQPKCDRPLPIQLDGKWGFVDLENGRLLFDPPAFDDLWGFDDGHAIVRQGNKWRIIDGAGRFLLSQGFDRPLGRRAGLFHVEMDGRKVWITAAGEERGEPPAERASAAANLDCGYGLKLFERGGRWGIADADGKTVVASRYRALVCFHNGVAWAPIDDARRWCALGPDGALRDKPECKTTHYPYFESHSSPERFHTEPYENSVLWTRAYLEFGAGRRESPPRMIHDNFGR